MTTKLNHSPELTCISCEDPGMSDGARLTSAFAAQALLDLDEPSETPDRLTQEPRANTTTTARPCDSARACYCC